MDFALLPPEINSGLMYTGPGAGPLLAAAASWDALAVESESAASAYASTISGLTATAWSGPASAAMATAAAPFIAWLQATATRAGQTAAQARAAVAAYETAFAMTVPPPVVAANRALLAALIATNFFGQNTAAIAATEAHYAEMWAQDSTAMYGYAASSAAASALTPFSQPPPTTNPAGLGSQARVVAQAAATAIGVHAHTAAHVTAHATSTSSGVLHQLASPMSSSSTSTTGSTGSTGLAGPASVLHTISSVLAVPDIASSAGSYTFDLGMGMYTVMTNSLGWAREILVAGGIEGYWTLQPLGPFHALYGIGSASAGLGQAASVGALSVPPSWAAAVSESESVALSLSAHSVSTASAAAAATPPGLAFQEALMGTMTGHGAVADETSRRRSKKANNGKDDDPDETGRSTADLISANGWLASAQAHHARQRSYA